MPHRRVVKSSLYRCFDGEGLLLYVGASARVLARIYHHLYNRPWAADLKTVTVEHFPTRMKAMQAERAAILLERPKFNVPLGTTRRPRRAYSKLVRHYGSEAKAARALDIPQSTVNSWSVNGIPHYRQSQIEHATNGKLRADKRRYNGQSAR